MQYKYIIMLIMNYFSSNFFYTFAEFPKISFKIKPPKTDPNKMKTKNIY